MIGDLIKLFLFVEIDIRAMESNPDLMKTYNARLTQPNVIANQVKLADELRAMLLEKRPDVVQRFQDEAKAAISTISRKVANN